MAPKRMTRSSKDAPAPPAKKVSFATVEEHHEIPPLEEEEIDAVQAPNMVDRRADLVRKTLNYALYTYDLEV